MPDDFPFLQEKLILPLRIELVTGLHVGGNDTGIAIGGADKVVVRNPLDGCPYLPGSSLKGKLRSLLERSGEAHIRVQIDGDRPKCSPCSCGRCNVCLAFGVAASERLPFEAGKPYAGAARLQVQDAFLVNAKEVASFGNLDMPYTEVKTEVSIDRLTSAANPRQFERVPAGARFQTHLILDLFSDDPREELLSLLIRGLKLLSADSLGGQGSRGYGAVELELERGHILHLGKTPWREEPLAEMAGVGLPVAFSLARTREAA